MRVLAGDFNMALWLVVPRLAEHGINMQYVASYAWECLESTEVHVDSCGVFVRGSWSIKRSFELGDCFLPLPDVLQAAMDRGRGEIYDSDAEEEAEDHVPGGKCARPIYEKLHMFLKGQGFPITSYLGPDAKRAASKDVMRELVGLCFNPTLEDKESAMFPRVKQKLVDPQKFDPKLELFAGGVHMPLLVYVGNGKPERGTGAWEKRMQRDQAFLEKRHARWLERRQQRASTAGQGQGVWTASAWGTADAPWDCSPSAWTATTPDPRSRTADDLGPCHTGKFHEALQRVQAWKATASPGSRPPWESEASSSGARGSNQGSAWATQTDVRGSGWEWVPERTAWAQPGEAWREDNAWPPPRRRPGTG